MILANFVLLCPRWSIYT